MSDTDSVLTDEGMRELMHRYFDACNAADVEAIAACFVADGVHYFPPGMYMGPFRGAQTIGERWRWAVETLGSVWTVDQIITDVASARAVMEWTHFQTFKGEYLRGDEWYDFDPSSGLIREIRAYYASPRDPAMERLELGDFDYEGRGYPLEPPFIRERPTE